MKFVTSAQYNTLTYVCHYVDVCSSYVDVLTKNLNGRYMPVTKKFYKAKFCGKELQRLSYRAQLQRGVTGAQLQVCSYRDAVTGTQLQEAFSTTCLQIELCI